MNKIEFHATIGIDRKQIVDSKTNIIDLRQHQQAQELGVLIAKTKGWETLPIDDMHVSRLDLYIFTREELVDFINERLKLSTFSEANL